MPNEVKLGHFAFAKSFSNLTQKTKEKTQKRFSGVFNVNFEYILFRDR